MENASRAIKADNQTMDHSGFSEKVKYVYLTNNDYKDMKKLAQQNGFHYVVEGMGVWSHTVQTWFT